MNIFISIAEENFFEIGQVFKDVRATTVSRLYAILNLSKINKSIHSIELTYYTYIFSLMLSIFFCNCFGKNICI